MKNKFIKLLGVSISLLDKLDILNLIENNIDSGTKSLISYVNIHAMNLSLINKRFSNILNNAELIFNDSYGIRLASRITGQNIPPRNTPPDWIDDLSILCCSNNFSLFFIGGKPGVAKKTAEKLKLKHPKLNILGAMHGYYNKLKESEENINIVNTVNNVKPDILIVGFGMPMQEFWIEDNFDDINAKIFLPVGAFFDYVSEEKYRSPKWITENGLEWIARLIAEPKRMWRRYIIGNPLFFYRVILEKLGFSKYNYYNS